MKLKLKKISLNINIVKPTWLVFVGFNWTQSEYSKGKRK